MTPEYKYVVVQVEGAVAIVKYNRPRSGNSLHPQVVSDMVDALKWADSQPEIMVIIQTGEGRFFSTGMDLDLKSAGPISFQKESSFHQLNKTLICSRKILIAAVNGPAAGYGVSSLALFDLVYSVPDAYFFTPFVKWGMAAEGASSVTFPRIMGHQKAAALFLAAERATAQELEQVGLITKILPVQGFLDQVKQIAQRITKSPPGSLQATKELMRGPVRQDLLDANDRECDVLIQRLESGEPAVAMKNFAIDQAQKRDKKASSRL